MATNAILNCGLTPNRVMATETENMDVDFCKKYTAKLQEKVILSANGQCQLWTGCKNSVTMVLLIAVLSVATERLQCIV